MRTASLALLPLSFLVLMTGIARCQDDSAGPPTEETGYELKLDPTLEWFGQAQIWSVFTRGADGGGGESIDDRWDLFVRRGRLGVLGRDICPGNMRHGELPAGRVI